MQVRSSSIPREYQRRLRCAPSIYSHNTNVKGKGKSVKQGTCIPREITAIPVISTHYTHLNRCLPSPSVRETRGLIQPYSRVRSPGYNCGSGTRPVPTEIEDIKQILNIFSNLLKNFATGLFFLVHLENFACSETVVRRVAPEFVIWIPQ